MQSLNVEHVFVELEDNNGIGDSVGINLQENINNKRIQKIKKGYENKSEFVMIYHPSAIQQN